GGSATDCTAEVTAFVLWSPLRALQDKQARSGNFLFRRHCFVLWSALVYLFTFRHLHSLRGDRTRAVEIPLQELMEPEKTPAPGGYLPAAGGDADSVRDADGRGAADHAPAGAGLSVLPEAVHRGHHGGRDQAVTARTAQESVRVLSPLSRKQAE